MTLVVMTATLPEKTGVLIQLTVDPTSSKQTVTLQSRGEQPKLTPQPQPGQVSPPPSQEQGSPCLPEAAQREESQPQLGERQQQQQQYAHEQQREQQHERQHEQQHEHEQPQQQVMQQQPQVEDGQSADCSLPATVGSLTPRNRRVLRDWLAALPQLVHKPIARAVDRTYTIPNILVFEEENWEAEGGSGMTNLTALLQNSPVQSPGPQCQPEQEDDDMELEDEAEQEENVVVEEVLAEPQEVEESKADKH